MLVRTRQQLISNRLCDCQLKPVLFASRLLQPFSSAFETQIFGRITFECNQSVGRRTTRWAAEFILDNGRSLETVKSARRFVILAAFRVEVSLGAFDQLLHWHGGSH